MKHLRGLGVLVIATLAISGCGSGSPVSIDEACASFATAACTKINTCYPFIVSTLY